MKIFIVISRLDMTVIPLLPRVEPSFPSQDIIEKPPKNPEINKDDLIYQILEGNVESTSTKMVA